MHMNADAQVVPPMKHDTTQPAALAEPTVRVGQGFVVSLALANLGLWMAFMAPIQVLLAQQMEVIVPGNKEAALGLVTGLGAFVSIFANPLIGAWSDRTTSRLGRRRPWLVGGAVIGAFALLMLGRQDSVAGAAMWWCVAQASLNAVYAALTASLPDQVPVRQRAMCGAWLGVTQPLGLVVSTVLVTTVASDIAMSYALVAGGLALCALPFALVNRDPRLLPADRPVFVWREFVRGFWISPRANPDYAWAFLMRFLVNLGNSIATLFMLYYLRDAIGYESLFPGEKSEDGLLIAVLIYTGGVVVGAFVNGAISDRSGRRKAPAVAACLVMATAASLLVVWQSWPALMITAGVLGLGFGAYMAIDQALVSQVLPTAGDRGKDLGMINIANSAPQVVAPAIAALLVTQLGGYRMLYLVSAAVIVLAIVAVHQVRGVR
jgi:MFS family permease